MGGCCRRCGRLAGRDSRGDRSETARCVEDLGALFAVLGANAFDRLLDLRFAEIRRSALKAVAFDGERLAVAGGYLHGARSNGDRAFCGCHRRGHKERDGNRGSN
jgi:hypothetical protein